MNDLAQHSLYAASETFGLPIAEPEEVGISSQRLQRIAPLMKAYVDNGRAPGVLTAIARHGKVVHVQAQGFADQEAAMPLKTDSIFRIYSMTKPVTAVALMLLYEEGKVFLDDPVADYLPEFSNMMVHTEAGLVPAESAITLRHLLMHTSGLTYSMVPNVPAVSALYEAAQLNEARSRLAQRNLAQHVQALAEFPLIAQPGTAWHYCEGVSVVARVIEVVSGQGYGDFIAQRIFAPLAMVDTGYSVAPENTSRLTALYEQQPATAEGAPTGFMHTQGYGGDYRLAPALEAGGAGLLSTAADYLRFAQMLLNAGELDGTRLLSPSSVKLIVSNQLGPEFGDQPLASLAPKYKGVGFGLCGYVVTDAIARGGSGSNGEYGWSGWASTRFWIDPQEGLIGLVFTQLIPQPDQLFDLSERMHQMTYQALVE